MGDNIQVCVKNNRIPELGLDLSLKRDKLQTVGGTVINLLEPYPFGPGTGNLNRSTSFM